MHPIISRMCYDFPGMRISVFPHTIVSMHSRSCPFYLQTVFHLMALFTSVRDILPQNSVLFAKFLVCCDSGYKLAKFTVREIQSWCACFVIGLSKIHLLTVFNVYGVNC